MDIVKEIDAYYTSGNSIPVSRATIKHEEWAAVKELIESLRNQLSTNTWISVEDRLPDIGERVLVVVYKYNNPENEEIELIGTMHKSNWHDDTEQLNVIYTPHKWMPLPPAPTHKER